jgi:cell fate regulator YaaT (PSP1 superfamily)
MALHIVGIRFQKGGKVYHFDSSNCCDLNVGEYAIVETARGRQLGEIIQVIENPLPPPEGTWKTVQRKATAQDLILRQIWHCKEAEALINCRKKATELKLVNIKFVASEFSFDGTRLAIMYCTEEDEKVDLRTLRRAMQRLYPRAQVEMHAIGPRDVAKCLGGMGACGLEERCCTAFLLDFSPISIKMAKEQGISLTPAEITGMCGRLRCCMAYEYEQYAEARKLLPKRNKRVLTPRGEGKVVDVSPLKQSVMVMFEGEPQAEFMRHEIQVLDEQGVPQPIAPVPVADTPEAEIVDMGEVLPASLRGEGAKPPTGPSIPKKPRRSRSSKSRHRRHHERSG